MGKEKSQIEKRDAMYSQKIQNNFMGPYNKRPLSKTPKKRQKYDQLDDREL